MEKVVRMIYTFKLGEEMMCQKRSTTLVRVIQFGLVGGKKPVRVDACLKPLIPFIDGHLNNCDLVACCCGHGRYPMTIVGKYRSDGHIRELLSGTDIPRKRNFYKKDSDGYYYIPEVKTHFNNKLGDGHE